MGGPRADASEFRRQHPSGREGRGSARLSPGEIELWYAFVADRDEPESERRQLALLSDEEHARHDRRRDPHERRSFRSAHALLRLALSHELEGAPGSWRFTQGAHGRPELDVGGADPPIRFNLAHTRGFVACVLARDGLLGVDVETSERRRNLARLAPRCCAASELADLQGRPDEEQRLRRFLAYWTLKEAYAKALGKGLSLSLRSAVFELQGEASARLVAGEERGPWHFFRLQPDARHQIAVAFAGEQPPRLCTREVDP